MYFVFIAYLPYLFDRFPRLILVSLYEQKRGQSCDSIIHFI